MHCILVFDLYRLPYTSYRTAPLHIHVCVWKDTVTFRWDHPNASSAKWNKISYCLINKDLCGYNIFASFEPTRNNFDVYLQIIR